MRVLTVPVKSLERSKSRLSSILGPAERAAITLAMLEDVLDACLLQTEWEVWVVSSDQAVLEVAARRGARALPEEGRSLNGAVRQVEQEVHRRLDQLAVLLGDLPLITADAVSAALSHSGSVVAVPAHSDDGTNLLLRRPPMVIPARFGRASFAKHRWAARRARVSFEEVSVPDLAFDLDRPEDLAAVVAADRPGRTGQVCLEIDLPSRLQLSRRA